MPLLFMPLFFFIGLYIFVKNRDLGFANFEMFNKELTFVLNYKLCINGKPVHKAIIEIGVLTLY